MTSYVHGSNEDARAFVRRLSHQQLLGRVAWFSHVIMNLPATAIEFLGAYRSAFIALRTLKRSGQTCSVGCTRRKR